MDSIPIIDNTSNAISNVPTFEPAYVNLDYVFYQVFRVVRGLIAFIASFLGIDIGEGSKLGSDAQQLGAAWLSWFKLFASIISILAIALIIYCLVRLWEIRKEAKEREKEMEVKIIEEETFTHNLKWATVLEHANSDNPTDWRLAILEADTMLETASQRLPVFGETLGERLKKIDKGDLRSIDSAWEAHKVRNRIAHDGLDFQITKRDTARTISQFEEVLRELGAI